jgi:subtilase family serine protease
MLTVLRASASPSLPAHSVALGPLPGATEVHLDVTLKLPDPSAVASFIASLSDRGSPSFHHFLSARQFGPLFGPSLSEVAVVDAVLRSDGLDPGQVTPDRLIIPLTAPASVIDRAFHVGLMSFRLPGGRRAFTTSSPPSISAALSSDVQGVIGLSDVDGPQSLLARSGVAVKAAASSSSGVHPMAAGPTPCAAAKAAAKATGSFTANELASYYDMTPLYSLGNFGQGVRVALVEFQSDLPADIAAYQACYGTSATVNYIKVDGGAGSGAGSGQAALDIETVIGLAPSATIDVYQGLDSTDAYTVDVYSKIITDDVDQVISTGWGECELDTEPSLITEEHSLFVEAAAQGQVVFAGAGNNGSTGCFGDKNTTNGARTSVLNPASQPDVIAVGGTSIGSSSENVWNDSVTVKGAGGGGVSSIWCMPKYQDIKGIQGMINPDSVSSASVKSAICPQKTPYMRQVPDVSADADPSTGYVDYVDGSWHGGQGGTSAAAALWAASAALIDSSTFCTDYASRDATGILEVDLYAIADSDYYPSALYDVTRGNNDYTTSGYSGGLYPATTGYDMASGLGTPSLAYVGNYFPGLAALTCFIAGTKLGSTSITSVSPDLAPSGHKTPVTITGTGFLPLAGADRLEVGKTWIIVSCSTTTTCTGTLPATKPGTLGLEMSVADLTLSSVTSPYKFTFVGAPTVTVVTPHRGPRTGGTTVTIWGSGFVGTVLVHFGLKPAKVLRVVSPSEIKVTAPPGSGSVYVFVFTVAGVSAKAAAGKFQYLSAAAAAG